MDVPITTEIQDPCFVFTDRLDREFLNSNYAKNLELAKNIFQSFLESSSSDLAKLKEEVKDNNPEQIASITHKIKNNFIYIGASGLSDTLIQLEAAAKENSDEIKEIYDTFNIALEGLLPVIQEELSRLGRYLKTKAC